MPRADSVHSTQRIRASSDHSASAAPSVEVDRYAGSYPVELLARLKLLRREAADEIERLIAFLDEIGPDADLEPNGDETEPSLASQEHFPQADRYRRRAGVYRDSDGSQGCWAGGPVDDDREGDAGFDDREGDELEHGGCGERDDYELSGDESEPSLGSFDRLTNQEHGWRQTGGTALTWHMQRNGDFEKDAAQ